MWGVLVLAHLGNTQAAYHLGVAYQRGDGVAQNYQKAEQWLLRAALQGSRPAAKAWTQLIKTAALQWDQQHPQNRQLDWLQLIRSKAQEDDPVAEFQLGLLYQYGQTYADMPAALYWYKRAALSFYPPALLKLGNVYDRGLGVRQNKWRAQYYLRLSREYWR